MNVIYVAFDPITQELRYVGQTRKGLTDREKRHRREASTHADHTHRWMRLLLQKNLWPRFEILEIIPDGSNVQKILDDVETDYISRFRNEGYPLTNTAPGGKGVGSGPEHPFYGKHHTLEALELIREASRNQIWTEERKKNISESVKGAKNGMFGIAGSSHPRFGMKNTPEQSRKQSERQLGQKRPSTSGDRHWTRQPGAVPPTLGKKMRPESVERMRIALRGRKNPTSGHRKPVVCLTDGKTYSSGKIAALAYSIDNLTVSRCCRDGKERKRLRFAFSVSPP